MLSDDAEKSDTWCSYPKIQVELILIGLVGDWACAILCARDDAMHNSYQLFTMLCEVSTFLMQTTHVKYMYFTANPNLASLAY